MVTRISRDQSQVIPAQSPPSQTTQRFSGPRKCLQALCELLKGAVWSRSVPREAGRAKPKSGGELFPTSTSNLVLLSWPVGALCPWVKGSLLKKVKFPWDVVLQDLPKSGFLPSVLAHTQDLIPPPPTWYRFFFQL